MSPPIITQSTTLRASQNQVSCDVAGESVILQMNSGIYYGTNPIATRIWSLLQSPTTVQQLCDTITSEYDVSPDRAQQDILALLTRLSTANLIEVANEQPA